MSLVAARSGLARRVATVLTTARRVPPASVAGPESPGLLVRGGGRVELVPLVLLVLLVCPVWVAVLVLLVLLASQAPRVLPVLRGSLVRRRRQGRLDLLDLLAYLD